MFTFLKEDNFFGGNLFAPCSVPGKGRVGVREVLQINCSPRRWYRYQFISSNIGDPVVFWRREG